MKTVTRILKRSWKWWLPPLMFVVLLLALTMIMNWVGDSEPMTYPVF